MNIYDIFETKKGLYYNVNQRKKAGTSRSKNAPEAPSAEDWKNAAKTAKEDINEGIEIVYELSEGAGEQLSVQQLAAISDAALDSAYGYGRSTPGNTFGWQANLASAAYAKQMIDRGITDVEAISDAVHKGWWSVAQKFVDNPDQFSDTEKLRANGKFDKKMADRKAQMVPFNQLTKDQQDIDTVVARAMLQAITGEQGVAEADPNAPYTPSPAKPFRNPPGFNKQGTGVGNKLAQQNRAELNQWRMGMSMAGEKEPTQSKGTPVPANAFAQGVLKDLKKVNVKDQGVVEKDAKAAKNNLNELAPTGGGGGGIVAKGPASRGGGDDNNEYLFELVKNGSEVLSMEMGDLDDNPSGTTLEQLFYEYLNNLAKPQTGGEGNGVFRRHFLGIKPKKTGYQPEHNPGDTYQFNGEYQENPIDVYPWLENWLSTRKQGVAEAFTPGQNSPYDCGGADSEYGRRYNPHKVVDHDQVPLTDPQERAEYRRGWEEQESMGGAKNKFREGFAGARSTKTSLPHWIRPHQPVEYGGRVYTIQKVEGGMVQIGDVTKNRFRVPFHTLHLVGQGPKSFDEDSNLPVEDADDELDITENYLRQLKLAGYEIL
jgi:hypothetical protein